VESNEECFNPYSQTFEPASVVYEYVEARIHEDITDEDAWKIAFTENSTSVDIGEAATIALIKKWREIGWEDRQILQITGKSITWLRETDHIIQLDEKCFDAFTCNEINRSVAVDLSKVEDVSDRVARLERSKEFAEKRLMALRQKAKLDLEKAEEAFEIAEANSVDAEIIGANQSKADTDLDEAQKKLEKHQTKSNSLEEKEAIVTSKDLRNALPDPTIRSLTMAKMNKHWFSECSKIITDGLEVDAGINISDVRLISLLAEKIEDGERSIHSILKEHHGNELLLEEEDEEDEEDEEECEETTLLGDAIADELYTEEEDDYEDIDDDEAEKAAAEDYASEGEI
jgi:hypothetical protein